MPKVTLVSHTQDPIGTLYLVWMQSRTNNALSSAAEYQRVATRLPKAGVELSDQEFNLRGKVLDTVEQLLHDDVPVLENISFTFHLQDVPISFREQMVRHRIGVVVGDNLSFDIIPDLNKSSFWSQTARMVSNADFATKGRFYTPKSMQTIDMNNTIDFGDGSYTEPILAQAKYEAWMRTTELLYNEFIAAGVPMEDARQILPMGLTHNITWTLSLKALMHVLGKRACWIAQYGLWGEVIAQIVSELVNKVHPMFAEVVQPPCFEHGEFKSCPFEMINRDRKHGEDPYPPCPLWAFHIGKDVEHSDDDEWTIQKDGTMNPDSTVQWDMFQTMLKDFRRLWGRDPMTGKILKETEKNDV